MLRVGVERLGVDGSEGYIRRMWRHVLDPSGTPDENGALPYVPFAPEQLGVELKPSSRVLDIGCLGGYGLADFARRRRAEGAVVPKLVGIDVDPRSVAVARQLAPHWGGSLADFLESSAEEMPFPDAWFDIVVARLVLPYTDVGRVIDGVARVLRPGGLWLVQLHDPRYYLGALRSGPKGLRDMVGRLRPLVRFAVSAVAQRPIRMGEAAMTSQQMEDWSRGSFERVPMQDALTDEVRTSRPYVLLRRRG